MSILGGSPQLLGPQGSLDTWAPLGLLNEGADALDILITGELLIRLEGPRKEGSADKGTPLCGKGSRLQPTNE